MKQTLKAIFTILCLFLLGAAIAALIYWLGNIVFNAGLSRSAIIVNIITDGIIFCVAALIFQRVREKRENNK